VILLSVWVRLPDGKLARTGDLACGDPDSQGRHESEFEYADSWLSHRSAFDLDPESLRLASGRARHRAFHLHPPLGVFEDALPDDWGRRLLVFDRRLRRGEQSEAHLLRELGADGLGALAFAEQGEPIPRRSPAAAVHLEELLEAAERFEAGKLEDRARLRKLLEAGSTPGGARPKALVDSGDGAWIAKFPSRNRDGRFDVVGLEAAAMVLARRAGLLVPDTRLVELGRRRALLVRRFDLAPPGGRRHMVSLKTLCKERPGVHVLAYGELATSVRKHSSAPRQDVAMLFRHMAFNAAIGNTDDHLKNFWMLHDDHGWRLAPAIDLVPDVGERREHALAFLYDHGTPSRSDLAAIAKAWAVKGADDIVDEVLRAARSFPEEAARCGVPASNIEEIGRDIEQRIERMKIA
jgi:serine/threonine-protein kinase HipA